MFPAALHHEPNGNASDTASMGYVYWYCLNIISVRFAKICLMEYDSLSMKKCCYDTT